MTEASLVFFIVSFVFALYTFYKTEALKRRLRIELNRLSDDSHAFLGRLMNSNVSEDLKERYHSFNHSIVTHLISIDKTLARDWILKNIAEQDWYISETNLQISLYKYRTFIGPHMRGKKAVKPKA